MKKTLLLVIFIGAINSHAQIVNIPDSSFKAALVNNPDINTNSDTEIQISEAAAADAISVIGMNITDLTGIEAFTGITVLYCNNNQLTSLDISANTALNYINCSLNQLTSLDFSANTALKELVCGGNQLTSLNISNNAALTDLGCYDNQLTSLDVSANTALTHLYCDNNQLMSLDVSANSALTFLYCNNNQLTSLNVSGNTALFHLLCYNNQLPNLNVSSNTTLAIFDCYNNQLTSLDVSANTILTGLDCSINKLAFLNVKNGYNNNLVYFVATNNPNLTCIQVDDTAYMNINWVNGKDSVASYSENCAVGVNELQRDIGNSFIISSNPFSYEVTLKTGNLFNATLTICNLIGQTLQQIKNISGQTITLSRDNLPNGLYFIRVTEFDKIISENKLVLID